MLLAEVKKLKVAELRAMLTERGLDPKGLKAELAVRLISAIEAGVEPIKSGNEGETTRETTDKSSKTHADELPKPSLEYERCAREQSPVCNNISNMRIRTCTDQSTQTDPNQLCSCAATRTIAQQLTSGTSDAIITHLNHPGEEVQQERPPQSPAHPVAVATAASVKMNVVSGCSSPVSEIPVSDGANEQDHCKSVWITITEFLTEYMVRFMIRYDFSPAVLNRQSDSTETVDTTLEEITGMKRPCNERGRDYYEFKEDIHYIRYSCLFVFMPLVCKSLLCEIVHLYARLFPFSVRHVHACIKSRLISDNRSLFACTFRTADL